MIGVRMAGAVLVITVGLGASLRAQDMSGMGQSAQPYVQKDVEYQGGMPGFSDKTKGSLVISDSIRFNDKHDQRLFAVAISGIDSLYGPSQGHGPSIGKILLSNLNPTNKGRGGGDDQNGLTLFVHTAAGSQAVAFNVKNGPSMVINQIQTHGGPLPANMNLPKGFTMPPGYGPTGRSTSPDTTTPPPAKKSP
jgi:hypothetical protein